jgi:hypothetical protein
MLLASLVICKSFMFVFRLLEPGFPRLRQESRCG